MNKLNAAQQIHQHLGVPIRDEQKQAHGAQNAKTTKSGPGRYATQGKTGNRIGKSRPVRAYKALMNAWAEKRITKATRHSDEHGAYTLVGKAGRIDYPSPRRKWLAGISAQRGY